MRRELAAAEPASPQPTGQGQGGELPGNLPKPFLTHLLTEVTSIKRKRSVRSRWTVLVQYIYGFCGLKTARGTELPGLDGFLGNAGSARGLQK